MGLDEVSTGLGSDQSAVASVVTLRSKVVAKRFGESASTACLS